MVNRLEVASIQFIKATFRSLGDSPPLCSMYTCASLLLTTFRYFRSVPVCGCKVTEYMNDFIAIITESPPLPPLTGV
jgi:hypothetical protein